MMQLSRGIEEFWEGKNVMVTGAAGFLGSYLCRLLVQAGAHVTAVDDLSSPSHRYNRSLGDVPINVMQVQAEALRLLISQRGFDVIFHLSGLAYAAQSVTEPLTDFRTNLEATVLFLETLRHSNFHGCLVYASSAAVYGQPKEFPITEATPPAPISQYGASKLSSEYYIRVYSTLYNFQALFVRLFSLYGPGQTKQVVFDIVRKILQSSGNVELLGDGTEIRDFLYVEDAATALLYTYYLLDKDVRTLNVCSGQGISIQMLAQNIVEIIGDDTGRISFTDQRRPGDPSTWIGCNQLLTSIGFRPRFELRHGLLLTIDWYRGQF